MALTPDEALDRLRSPFALEDLGGAAPFVVDVTRPFDVGDLATVLRALPCVTIGVGPAPSSPGAGAFDVVVTEHEVDDFVAAVGRNPIASLALVQLLRASEAGDVWARLVAESTTYSMLQAGPELRRWLEARTAPATPTGDTGAEPIVAARDGDRVRITLNRPAVHNAFNAAMRDALVTHLRAASADPSVTSVCIDGAGPSFCSGGDLDEFGTSPDPATAHTVRMTRSPAWWLDRCAARTSVALHGACIGAGIELAAFAHDLAAAEDAFFQLPEVGFGLVPGAGGTVSLPRRIGRQRTAWMALSGQRVDAAAALAWGLVDRVSGRPRPR
jgi:enoyl-CoA hydratase/carnithine racemase